MNVSSDYLHALQEELGRLREALAIVGRHLEDCCRSDMSWREAVASHDRAVRAVAGIGQTGRDADGL